MSSNGVVGGHGGRSFGVWVKEVLGWSSQSAKVNCSWAVRGGDLAEVFLLQRNFDFETICELCVCNPIINTSNCRYFHAWIPSK